MISRYLLAPATCCGNMLCPGRFRRSLPFSPDATKQRLFHPDTQFVVRFGETLQRQRDESSLGEVLSEVESVALSRCQTNGAAAADRPRSEQRDGTVECLLSLATAVSRTVTSWRQRGVAGRVSTCLHLCCITNVEKFVVSRNTDMYNGSRSWLRRRCCDPPPFSLDRHQCLTGVFLPLCVIASGLAILVGINQRGEGASASLL